MVSDIPDTIQTAYRVRVGSWDTGRVESGDSLFVPYAGPALQPPRRPPRPGRRCCPDWTRKT